MSISVDSVGGLINIRLKIYCMFKQLFHHHTVVSQYIYQYIEIYTTIHIR